MKLFLCGLCPLPFENTVKTFGPGIRTWQFAYSLARAGSEVHVVAMQIPGAYGDTEAVREETYEGVRIERVTADEFSAPATIRSRISHLSPDALVGATVYGSAALAGAHPEIPFWADQFGHVMAEAQAKAWLEKANWPLAYFWDLLSPVLHRADKLSCVSRRQRYATIGELGALGRLTAETCGYEWTSVIPCGLVPPRPAKTRPMLRGREIPDDAFVVLWSGGYNVWSDVDTLFRGLELAMEKEPRLHFVSTGGAIGGHDETTYPGFEEQVKSSKHKDRFHLQGWVRAELVPSFQAEADLGVLTEVAIYEGRLGHKNRIVQWMGTGLPVAYNTVGDLGELLATENLGLTFPVGDAESFADRILWAAEHPDELRRLTERAKAYAERELSFEATTRELVSWAASPRRAPDAALRAGIRSPADFGPRPSDPEAAAPSPSERETDARRELAEIHSSRMWRLWMRYLALRRFFLRPFPERSSRA